MPTARIVYAALSLLAVGVLSQHRAIAQDVGGCYMVDSSGRTLNLGSLCGQSPAVDPGVYRAPIKRRIGGTPVIEVTFNGRQTFEMIVDTGASTTLITQDMAQALRVEPVGFFRGGIADGREVTFPAGYVESVAVSGASAQNIKVAIAEKMPIGLLGHNFFNNYDVSIREDFVEFHRR